MKLHRPKRFYRHTNAQMAQQARGLYFSRQMKQAQLAEHFNVRQGTVSRWISQQVWVRP